MGNTLKPQSEQPSDDQTEDVAASPRRALVSPAFMFILSLVLLGGAGYFVYRATDGFAGVWESVSSAPWWMIVLILISPLGNHVSVALCLQALQSRHGKVGISEMFVLVGSAWLFNYMPMRPGLIGRIGYHKAINNIRLRDSLESSIWSGVLAGVSNCTLIVMALVMAWVWGAGSVWLLGVPVVVFFGASLMMPGKRSKLIVKALGYRQIDVLVWLGRYWLAFHVLGLEMSLSDIAIISAVSQLVSLIPLTGSGIGFREWGVGLTASAGGHAMSTATAADLMNRIAETVVVLPVGLVCTAIVARHWKKTAAANQSNKVALSEDDAGADADEQDQSGDACQQDPAVG